MVFLGDCRSNIAFHHRVCILLRFSRLYRALVRKIALKEVIGTQGGRDARTGGSVMRMSRPGAIDPT